jgi:hypothetical protein
MNLEQIKQAVAQGYPVHWSNTAYEVILDNVGQYLIRCSLNDSCIGLTWLDGVTMNGEEEEFFLGEEVTK